MVLEFTKQKYKKKYFLPPIWNPSTNQLKGVGMIGTTLPNPLSGLRHKLASKFLE